MQIIVAGELSTDEALRILLADSGLGPRYVGDRAIALIAASTSTGPANQPVVEEVVVTAQKRLERLRDVPAPVSVLNTDSLAENNHVLLRDHAASVPGFNVTPNYVGFQNLTIRGITKYVTKEPSTAGYVGRVEAGTSSVRNGNEPGFIVRGPANLPVDDTFAVRISGFTRQDPGYIDNPRYRIEGVNQATADGARFAAAWTPTEDLSMKLSALYQHNKLGGLQYKRPESYEVSDTPLRDDAGKVRRSLLKTERLAWLETGRVFAEKFPYVARAN